MEIMVSDCQRIKLEMGGLAAAMQFFNVWSRYK